jgi:hypothetical protein
VGDNDIDDGEEQDPGYVPPAPTFDVTLGQPFISTQISPETIAMLIPPGQAGQTGDGS